MKSLFTSLLLLSSITSSLPLHSSSVNEIFQGYVKFSGHKVYYPTKTSMLKRDGDTAGSVDYNLSHEKYFYSVDVQIGSDGDNVTLLVDTGSSDMWVMDSSLKGRCGSDSSCQFGLFDTSDSSTFHNNNTEFGISYADVKLVSWV
ncbi:unnamed protein product [Ambrosiozyma monospora]|uniref:Unnamed protein product n=1 Tax=Ambrosiozyma monospora TaxID=43982 RepID=A0ACB5TP23_AMBMO|nr:unnamed protein product [Ambrosiozyma monospora]